MQPIISITNMQPTDQELSIFFKENLGIPLDKDHKFIRVKKCENGYQITSYSEEDCKNIEKTIAKQHVLFTRLIDCLRTRCNQRTKGQVPVAEGHYIDCKLENPHPLSPRNEIAILNPQDPLCSCAKIYILFFEIKNKCNTLPSSAYSLFADNLELHLQNFASENLHSLLSGSDDSISRRSSSQSQSDSDPSLPLLRKKSSRSKSPFNFRDIGKRFFGDSISETPENVKLYTDITELEDKMIDLCCAFWTSKYAKNSPIKRIYKTPQFKEFKLSLPEKTFQSLEDNFFKKPCMSIFLQQKVERLMVAISKEVCEKDSKAPDNAAMDLNRMIPYFTLSDPENELRSLCKEEPSPSKPQRESSSPKQKFNIPLLNLKLQESTPPIQKNNIPRLNLSLQEPDASQSKLSLLEMLEEDIELVEQQITMLIPEHPLIQSQTPLELSSPRENKNEPIKMISIQPVVPHEKAEYFERIINFILDYLTVNPVSSDEKLSKIIDLPNILFDKDPNHNDAFNEYCNKYITALQKIKKEKGDKVDSRIVILLHILLACSQRLYTIPGHAIINLFSETPLAFRSQSNRMHLHFFEDKVQLSLQCSLVPRLFKEGEEQPPFEIVLKSSLCSKLSKLPNWTSSISVKTRGLIPPNFRKVLEDVGLTIPPDLTVGIDEVCLTNPPDLTVKLDEVGSTL